MSSVSGANFLLLKESEQAMLPSSSPDLNVSPFSMYSGGKGKETTSEQWRTREEEIQL